MSWGNGNKKPVIRSAFKVQLLYSYRTVIEQLQCSFCQCRGRKTRFGRGCNGRAEGHKDTPFTRDAMEHFKQMGETNVLRPPAR